MADSRLTRLAIRWQSEDDTEMRERLFRRVLDECMKMPVVRSARYKTACNRGGHNRRYADLELQAIRSCVWRSLLRYDPERRVPYERFVSHLLRLRVADFWRAKAWHDDLCVHVPDKDYRRWRADESRRARGEDVQSDPALDLACRHSGSWLELGVCNQARLASCGEWDDAFEEEWDDELI